MKNQELRNWSIIENIWKDLADKMRLNLIRVKSRGKEPNEGTQWQDLLHRPYDDIGFQPNDNAGIITNNILVLDVDNLELFNRQIPKTFTVKTGKGFHYYFRRPDHADYRNRSIKAEGFDIRANGGYVVAPGSIHPNGSVYELIDDRQMADAPEWLLEMSRGGNIRINREQIIIGELPEVDLNRLDKNTRSLISEGKSEGQRSEAIYRVMHSMLDAGFSPEEIVIVVISNAIGEKAFEKNDPEGWLLDELERVINNKGYRTIIIPEAGELSVEYRALVDYSHRDLIEMLRDYGNVTSQAQEDVLKSLMLTYASMAEGKLTGRIATPLPTGFGKTTSIIALLGRAYNMHMLGRDFTVAITASKVEQICDLYKELVKAGITRKFLSLIHHKKDGSKVDQIDGQLPEGYADIAATKDDNGEFITNRPILLVTHNKVKGKLLNDLLAKQTFVIWDESLISTEANSFDVKDLNLGVAAFNRAAERLEVSNETIEFISRCHTLIEQNIADQRKTGVKSLLKLPTSDTAKQDIEQVIKAERHIASSRAMETLLDLIKFTEFDLSVYLAQNDETVICYEVVVPDSLQNIVILDASTMVNELMLLDRLIFTPENFPIIPVSYTNTIVNRLDHRAGRSAIEEALKGDVLKATLLEIMNKHKDESVLLFTFKHRDGKLHHRATIEEYFTKNKIDIQERLRGSPRFNWLTHGNETASNKYSYCTVAIFVGVLYEPDQSYISKTIGQMRNHTAMVNAGVFTKVMKGSQGQAVHQGANRCASRIFKDDIASPVNVYFTYPDDSLSPVLRSVLPDANFRVYDSEILQPRTQKHQMAKVLARFLMDLPKSIVEVSSRHLSSLLPEITRLSRQQRSRVMALVNDNPAIPWTWVDRRLIRLEAQYL